jgi:1-acyl-sn-glycerol-3-phosphate acyltransferase
MNLYYWLGYNLSRILARIFYRFRIVHRERVIQTGPVVLAMNHQSFFDPPLAGNAADRPIYYLAKKSLMHTPILGWLLPKLNVIPVDVQAIDRSAIKALVRVINAGNCALVFPEGSRTTDGVLHPGLPGIGFVIAKTLAPVVPMRIFGAYEAWPIGGRIRLGSQITIVVGEPIRFTAADVDRTAGKDVYARISQRVMDAIAEIKLPEHDQPAQDNVDTALLAQGIRR